MRAQNYAQQLTEFGEHEHSLIKQVQIQTENTAMPAKNSITF